MKIAPVLQNWIDHGGYTLDEDLLYQANKELRALLAVARVASAIVNKKDQWTLNDMARVARALARLEKVSKP